MAKDSNIEHRLDRVEEIINQLDADEVSLEDGREFYAEGQESLAEIRDQLHDKDGEVIEIE